MSINIASSTISPELKIQNITFPVTTFNLTQRCLNLKSTYPILSSSFAIHLIRYK